MAITDFGLMEALKISHWMASILWLTGAVITDHAFAFTVAVILPLKTAFAANQWEKVLNFTVEDREDPMVTAFSFLGTSWKIWMCTTTAWAGGTAEETAIIWA